MTEETAGTPCLKDECCSLRKIINEHYGPENTRLKDEVAALTTQLDELQKRLEHMAVPSESQCESPPDVVPLIRDCLMKSKLFAMFTQQEFWHAHYVSLVWRYNGQDVLEEADWLKDIWYALRNKTGTQAATTLPTNGTALRAELDAAKRALAEKDAVLERVRDYIHLPSIEYRLKYGIDLDAPNGEGGVYDMVRMLNAALSALSAKSTEPSDQHGGL